MSGNLRVLVLFEGTFVSGPAKNLLQFVRTMREAGSGLAIEVAVFVRVGEPTVLPDAFRSADIPVHVIPERFRFDTRVIQTLRDLVESRRPDILQSHFGKSHFLIRSARLHRRVPWLAFHHGYTNDDWKVVLYDQLDRWSLRAARQVVCVNEAFRNDLRRLGVKQGRIRVIHNAIDMQWARNPQALQAAAALRQQLRLDPDSKVLLIAARLSQEKNHMMLLESLARLRDHHGQTPYLLVAGDGPEREHLNGAIPRLGLARQVVMLGWVPSAEPYYAIADVVVLPSRSEGSPNAILEAMGAERAIVATRVGGIPELVTDEDSALLVPSADPDAMTRALARVLTSDDLRRRLARRARETVIRDFSPEARFRAISAIYDELRH